MRQFNTPPQWPAPPTPRWRPPRRWRPPTEWPTAPKGWSFWVDEHGQPVRGPVGRYGGGSRLAATAIVVIPTALMTLVLVNPWHAGDSASTTPTVIPMLVPATEAPIHRTQKPTRQSARTPTLDTPAPTAAVLPTSTVLPKATVVYKDCAAVRAAHKAPLPRGNPGYSRALDRNHDGIACSRGD
ncbi:excalibur calcium-binding domain-containing protein [Kribbella sp. NPDC055071]